MEIALVSALEGFMSFRGGNAWDEHHRTWIIKADAIESGKTESSNGELYLNSTFISTSPSHCFGDHGQGVNPQMGRAAGTTSQSAGRHELVRSGIAAATLKTLEWPEMREDKK